MLKRTWRGAGASKAPQDWKRRINEDDSMEIFIGLLVMTYVGDVPNPFFANKAMCLFVAYLGLRMNRIDDVKL